MFGRNFGDREKTWILETNDIFNNQATLFNRATWKEYIVLPGISRLELCPSATNYQLRDPGKTPSKTKSTNLPWTPTTCQAHNLSENDKSGQTSPRYFPA